LFVLSKDKSFKKTIFFIGVFHGDEFEGEILINKLADKIKANLSIIKDNKLLFIPCLNPDGKNQNTRGNSSGVDLNRNFPTKNWELSHNKNNYYSGEKPESEIETGFLTEIIKNYKPDLIITLHTPFKIINYDGPAQEIAKNIAKYNKYPVQSDIGYPTPGSFGTYCGVERNIPTITLELPENTDIEILWEENKEAFFYLCSI
ncbi:MAG: M14 family murein peptide amidase A, partial [Candidatus Gastranaerophilales bacterium]|nr:M14 family murein peptide amidase A [Candidatus Gastranaerophilales bacterium]